MNNPSPHTRCFNIILCSELTQSQIEILNYFFLLDFIESRDLEVKDFPHDCLDKNVEFLT